MVCFCGSSVVVVLTTLTTLHLKCVVFVVGGGAGGGGSGIQKIMLAAYQIAYLINWFWRQTPSAND